MKKFLSVFLTLALLLTLFPLTALASEPFSLEAPKNLTGELKISLVLQKIRPNISPPKFLLTRHAAQDMPGEP